MFANVGRPAQLMVRKADFVFRFLANVIFHKKEEQEIREEFLKLDTDRSGFITKGERFKTFEIIFCVTQIPGAG